VNCPGRVRDRPPAQGPANQADRTNPLRREGRAVGYLVAPKPIALCSQEMLVGTTPARAAVRDHSGVPSTATTKDSSPFPVVDLPIEGDLDRPPTTSPDTEQLCKAGQILVVAPAVPATGPIARQQFLRTQHQPTSRSQQPSFGVSNSRPAAPHGPRNPGRTAQPRPGPGNRPSGTRTPDPHAHQQALRPAHPLALLLGMTKY
jgi:hypothetical protein